MHGSFSRAREKATKAAEPVDMAEVEQLWQQGALGESDPAADNMVAHKMGALGCDKHLKFKFGDFQLKKVSDGADFIVEFSHERGTKTRTGLAGKSTNASQQCLRH